VGALVATGSVLSPHCVLWDGFLNSFLLQYSPRSMDEYEHDQDADAWADEQEGQDIEGYEGQFIALYWLVFPRRPR
jgi:hypothetical protein